MSSMDNMILSSCFSLAVVVPVTVPVLVPDSDNDSDSDSDTRWGTLPHSNKAASYSQK